MEDVLYNPVYNALLSGDAHLGFGMEQVKYFDEAVSPFAGFHHNNNEGFDQLYQQLPAGRKILYATPGFIKEPKGWQLVDEIKGVQFVHEGKTSTSAHSFQLVPLHKGHAGEMVQLAALTKPGPFALRTIEFGNYHGIFEDGRLVAMTGQRLHVANYTEISAVCTHPDFLGKGYAAALMLHQMNLIHGQGQIPFLHVREDNSRAIALYERL